MKKASTTLEETPKTGATWLFIVGIILIATNLRAPLTSVGSLISAIRDDLSLSSTLAGTITTLPLLAFALLSPFAPKIAKKIGMEWTIFVSLIVLVLGIILRSSFGTISLFGGTLIIGIAIAMGNVLLPGFIKTNFPLKIGMMTGIYAVFMNIFGALGSGVSVPIASLHGWGWQGSLAVWAALALVSLLVWIPQLRKRNNTTKTTGEQVKGKASLLKSPLAWHITLFMGLQSLMFYTLITWLPAILEFQGFSSAAAGWMLFLMQFSLIPVTFIIPVIAEKMDSQKTLSVITAMLFMIGIGILLTGMNSLLFISAILIGVACGSAFSLSMMFFTLRTSDGQQAAEMSGMAQSLGYLFAAVGPVLFGALHDLNGGWTIPLILLLVLSGVILVSGYQAGQKRVISDMPEQTYKGKAV